MPRAARCCSPLSPIRYGAPGAEQKSKVVVDVLTCRRSMGELRGGSRVRVVAGQPRAKPVRAVGAMRLRFKVGEELTGSNNERGDRGASLAGAKDTLSQTYRRHPLPA